VVCSRAMRYLVISLSVVALVACDAGGSAARTGLEVVGEPRITQGVAFYRADGRVENTATRPCSGAVKVTLFDHAARIVGVYSGAVNDVQPGDEVTYTAIGTDKPEKWSKVEAKIDYQVPC
jgi:hypothetical protein